MMNRKLVAAAFALAGLLAGPAQAQVDDIVDLTSLIRNVRDPVDPNVGHLRVIIPSWNATRDANGAPLRATLRFNLYDPTSGSNAVLFQTGARAVTLPALPCSNPTNVNDDYSVKFFGRWNGRREAVVFNYVVFCNESGTGQYKEARSTFVYSADVTQAGASTWVRNYPLALIGANSLDLTNGSGTLGVQDDIGDTMMLTLEGASGPRVILLDWNTGELFSNPAWTMPSDRSYPAGNF